MKVLRKLGAAGIGILLLQASIADVSANESVDVVDATDPDNLVTIIQDLGYRAKLEVDDDGDPLIRSSVGGSQFSILFFGCDEDSHDQCKLLLFRIGYDFDDTPSPESIESWNEETLIGRAYLDSDNDPWLEWAVNMDGGVSRRNFEDSFDWWEVSVADFEEHINYEG